MFGGSGESEIAMEKDRGTGVEEDSPFPPLIDLGCGQPTSCSSTVLVNGEQRARLNHICKLTNHVDQHYTAVGSTL